MKAQFNVRIPKALADRLRADARRAGRSLDDVAASIFEDFVKGWTVSERAKFYAHAQPKRVGRPIEEAAP